MSHKIENAAFAAMAVFFFAGACLLLVLAWEIARKWLVVGLGLLLAGCSAVDARRTWELDCERSVRAPSVVCCRWLRTDLLGGPDMQPGGCTTENPETALRHEMYPQVRP